MSEWQPIGSAPKTGIKVLLFGQDGIGTGYYDPGVKGHEDKFPEGWRCDTYEPTHWMPLPDPPTEGERMTALERIPARVHGLCAFGQTGIGWLAVHHCWWCWVQTMVDHEVRA